MEASTSNAELTLQQAEQRSAKKRKRSGASDNLPAAYGGARAYSSSDSEREMTPPPRHQESISSPDQKQSPGATDRDKCQAKFDPY